jgi:hypothetical protein
MSEGGPQSTGLQPVGTWRLEIPKAPGGGDTLRCQRMLKLLGHLTRALCRPSVGLKRRIFWGAAFHPLTRMARRLPPLWGLRPMQLIALRSALDAGTQTAGSKPIRCATRSFGR